MDLEACSESSHTHGGSNEDVLRIRGPLRMRTCHWLKIGSFAPALHPRKVAILVKSGKNK